MLAERGLFGERFSRLRHHAAPALQPPEVEIGLDHGPVGVCLAETALPPPQRQPPPQGEQRQKQAHPRREEQQAQIEGRALGRLGLRRGRGRGHGGVGAPGRRGSRAGGGRGLRRFGRSAALAGLRPGVGGGDLHGMPPVAVQVDLHPGMGVGVGHAGRSGRGHVGHVAGHIPGGDAVITQQQDGGAGKMHAVAPAAFLQEPAHVILPLRDGGRSRIVHGQLAQVVGDQGGKGQGKRAPIAAVHQRLIVLVLRAAGQTGLRLGHHGDQVAVQRVAQCVRHAGVVLIDEAGVFLLGVPELLRQLGAGERVAFGLHIERMRPDAFLPGQISVVYKLPAGDLFRSGEQLIGIVYIARIGAQIADGDAGVVLARNTGAVGQGGKIHGLNVVPGPGGAVGAAVEGLALVALLIQGRPGAAVVYRAGKSAQVEPAPQGGADLQHRTPGIAQGARVGQVHAGVGPGQGAAAPQLQAGEEPVAYAHGPVGDRLVGLVRPGGAPVGLLRQSHIQQQQHECQHRQGDQTEPRASPAVPPGGERTEHKHAPAQQYRHQGQPCRGQGERQGNGQEGKGEEQRQKTGAQPDDGQAQQRAQRRRGAQRQRGGGAEPGLLRELGDGVNVAVAAQTVGNGIVNGAAQGDLAQRQRIPETPQGQEPQPQQEQQKQQERQAAPGQGKDPQEKQGAGGAAQQQRQGQNRRAEGG